MKRVRDWLLVISIFVLIFCQFLQARINDHQSEVNNNLMQAIKSDKNGGGDMVEFAKSVNKSIKHLNDAIEGHNNVIRVVHEGTVLNTEAIKILILHMQKQQAGMKPNS